MLKEFRDFIAKGNVMDMAVGIIIGAAFTAIVTSLVGDIINPLLSIITGNTDFSANYIVLRGTAPEGASLEAAKEAGATVWAYGSFITAVINFLIIAFVVFLLVKGVNKIKETAMRKEEAQASAAGPSQEALLAEIRDLLAAQRGGVAVDPTLGAPRQY
ncbi:large conductance mechanosensitive channel protein MscL [Paracoccus panacisoli]|uniref:Large-conductance mechanosensitive channel n=1 Tax=Paracoccus panacisoli TaxID=1510163 RepID=A0ABV6T9H1_9RHOB|nr:large conductance mechanosensitive channel protein MscL [Paracoccus sanguinis]QJD16920.1 large conductance mechanosensitive channel protein MscL [Paracoccus sanguinis]